MGKNRYMRVLGVNAVFHDPSAALVADGRIVAAAEEERFTRRKHGKRPVPFSAWELPREAMHWCLREAGLRPCDLDAIAYSFDPALSRPADELGLDDPWDHLRRMYAENAPGFIAEALAGVDPAMVQFVPHHAAHAASAGLLDVHGGAAGPSVLVVDGRGECSSHLAGHYDRGRLTTLSTQALPDSLGLVYEALTEHLGFLRSSDEFKVMALASYGTPRYADQLREWIHGTGDGGFHARVADWDRWAPRRLQGQEDWESAHADLAASVQRCVEEALLDVVAWLHRQTGAKHLAMAGGTALNCVANTRISNEGPFEHVWVQPAAGDAGTSLGAALHLISQESGGEGLPVPFPTAALGRSWSDDQLAAALESAQIPYETPDNLAAVVADVLADDGVVAWFDGRSELGPRALGQRSLLAHPGHEANLDRLNAVKGREDFRPVAPMVLQERAAEIFSRGPLPSPYMLFVHDVDSVWASRIPAVTHVDCTARVQTVDPQLLPRLAATIEAFADRTGLPVVINTSLNTAGRPMVDTPRDALELFGSAPVDLLVLGPHVVRRAEVFAAASA